MSNDWKATSFTVKTDRGDYLIAGWVNGLFALDFRVRERQPGWQLTHIPTGFVAGFIEAPLQEAFALVDEIAALGDWQSVKTSRVSPQIVAGMRALRDAGVMTLRTADTGPLKYSLRADEVSA